MNAEEVTTVSRCMNHPEREAVGDCPSCGRPFCSECFAPPDVSGRRLCLDCAVRDTAGELAGRREAAPVRTVVPQPRAAARKWLVPLLLVLVVLEAGAYLGLRASVGSVAVMDSAEVAEAADLGDLLMVQEILRDRWESSGRVPTLAEVARDLPEDLAERIGAGDLQLEPADSGFVLSMRTATGRVLAVNQDGEQVETAGGGS